MYNGNNNTLISGSFVSDGITNFGNRVTIIGGDREDDINNSGGSSVVLNGGGGDDYFYSSGKNCTIDGGEGNDDITNYGERAVIYGGVGNDVIENKTIGKSSTIVGGEGDDTIRMSDYDAHNVIQYAEGDGNDIVEDTYNYNKFDATLQITSGTYSLAYDGDDLLVKVGNGSIRFLGKAEGKTINIEGTPAGTLVTTTNDTVAPATTTTTTTETVTTTTTTTTTESTTTAFDTTTTSTPATTASGGGDTIINNNYYYDMSGNNGTIINQSSIGGDVTNNTTVDNSITIIKEGDTYTYNGGDKVIENYQQGEVVKLASDYQGIDLSGNSFFVKSSSGQLEIQNSRDKFIGYSAESEVVAYSYVASGGGNVDGRDKNVAEIMIGADNANNQIYAGSGGSSLWGGNGGADTLTGGDGYDEFFYAVGSGSDVMQSVGDNDLINLASVNLSQISGVDVKVGQVNINFVDGGSLQVQGGSGIAYRIAEGTFAVNQSTKQWSAK